MFLRVGFYEPEVRIDVFTPEASEANEPMKDKPNPKILAKSTHGMVRPMDNFTAQCFMEHMDAIQNASTNEPEPVKH